MGWCRSLTTARWGGGGHCFGAALYADERVLEAMCGMALLHMMAASSPRGGSRQGGSGSRAGRGRPPSSPPSSRRPPPPRRPTPGGEGALYYAVHKPFNVLCQFSPEGDKRTLKDLLPGLPSDVYPVGRLDYDSEGLLLLSNDAALNSALLTPSHGHSKEYWCQVEGQVTQEALQSLCRGVELTIRGKPFRTSPAKAALLPADPQVADRDPPIRYRAAIPTSWLRLEITEGKNRQVRKMTAAVGFPTLRLIRWRINGLSLEGLGLREPGSTVQLETEQVARDVLRTGERGRGGT